MLILLRRMLIYSFCVYLCKSTQSATTNPETLNPLNLRTDLRNCAVFWFAHLNIMRSGLTLNLVTSYPGGTHLSIAFHCISIVRMAGIHLIYF